VSSSGDAFTASVSAIWGEGFDITFHGVRGSTPCHGEEIARYGGNTSCVSVDVPGQEPLLFDLGTGARYFGLLCDPEVPFHGSCLISHLHWDHVQGLPFFPPILRPGNHLDFYAPIQEDDASIGTVIRNTLGPPMFPVTLDDFPGDVSFHAKGDEDFMIGDVLVKSRLIPHVGNTLGYRIEFGGAAVAYLSDHQQPGVDVYEATDNALELCDGVDLLIHDAQYSRAEFAMKATWGHCTVEYATWLAKASGAKQLALYHHDPNHHDDEIDTALAMARDRCHGSGTHVVAASEGLTLHVGR
jgi:phosphoribosyl 1,2-cyclic phosphodiesterase